MINEKILVLGAAGFIGSNFVRQFKKSYKEMIGFDKFTEVADKGFPREAQIKFINGDICNTELLFETVKHNNIDTIINFAAESHNSNAILNPHMFFKSNVMGVQSICDVVKQTNVSKALFIETCEQYGDLELDSTEKFTEESPFKPNTPYNASKAAGGMVVRSYIKTFGIPAIMSIACNNFGPYQHPEKVIPKFITNLCQQQRIPIYKSFMNKREWIHVNDHCDALQTILSKGKIGETYNVGSGVEVSVEDLADYILAFMNKDEEWKHYVEDRPQHDKRYLLDSSKIKEQLGWSSLIKTTDDFKVALEQTIEWYVMNFSWWTTKKAKADEFNWSAIK